MILEHGRTDDRRARVAVEGVGAARARMLYATDPICSHCWAMEPAWRRPVTLPRSTRS